MTPTIDDSKVLFTNNDHFVGVSGSCRMQGSYEGGNIDLITGFNVIYSIVPVPVSGPLDPLTCKFQVADFKIHLDATPADASVIPNEVIELGKRAVLIALNQSSLGIDDMESAKKVFRPYALGRTQGKIAPIFPDLANLECVVSARQIDHSIQEDGIYYFSEDGTCLITGTKDGQHVKQIIPFRILFSIIKNPEAGGEPYLIADVKFRIDVASKGFPGRD
jgi:hypothetical protein